MLNLLRSELIEVMGLLVRKALGEMFETPFLVVMDEAIDKTQGNCIIISIRCWQAVSETEESLLGTMGCGCTTATAETIEACTREQTRSEIPPPDEGCNLVVR